MDTSRNQSSSVPSQDGMARHARATVVYGPKQSEVLSKDDAKDRDKVAFPTPEGVDSPVNWTIRIIAFLIFLLVYPVVSMTVALFTEAPLLLDKPSPRTVIAGQQIKVIDTEATQLQRREASNKVQEVVVPDNAARSQFIQAVSDAFTSIEDIRHPQVSSLTAQDTATDPPTLISPPKPQTTPEEVAKLITERIPSLGKEGGKLLSEMTDRRFDTLRNAAVHIAQNAAQRTITADTLEHYKTNDLINQLAVSGVPFNLATAIIGPIIKDNLTPTFTKDEAATKLKRVEAANAVDDVVFIVPKGMPIVRTGEVISKPQIEALELAGLQGTDPLIELRDGFGITLLMVLVVGMYIAHFRPHIWNNESHLLLISMLFSGFSLFVVLADTITTPMNLHYYAVPIAAVTLLATILFDQRIGVLITVPCIAVASTLNSGFLLLPWLMFMALAPLTFISHKNERQNLRLAVGRTFVVAIVSGTLGYILLHGTEGVLWLVGMTGLHGVLTVVLVLALLPILESAFNIVTQTSLFNLADRNHPLLRELESSALGTYNHSVMVSTLASRAARAIGANAMLVEVMALYHDIGKLERPYFFVENQAGMSNPHDDLHDPVRSADIIHRHVPDGARMAILHRMPKEIINGIRTHHGNTVVAFFYRVAIKEAAEQGLPEPDIATFRYRAPRPFTKEQAVLMLADGCEGATRAASMSTGQLSRVVIEKIVSGIISDRVRDGQLDQSPLTFNDLRTVESTLISSLEGIYHPRVAYPKAPTD